MFFYSLQVVIFIAVNKYLNQFYAVEFVLKGVLLEMSVREWGCPPRTIYLKRLITHCIQQPILEIKQEKYQ